MKNVKNGFMLIVKTSVKTNTKKWVIYIGTGNSVVIYQTFQLVLRKENRSKDTKTTKFVQSKGTQTRKLIG